MDRLDRLLLSEDVQVRFAAKLAAYQIIDELEPVSDLRLRPAVEQKVADELKDLVLEITSPPLNFMQDLAHHVTVLESLNCSFVLNLMLKESQLLAGAKEIVLFEQKVYFFSISCDFLEYLQSLRY